MMKKSAKWSLGIVVAGVLAGYLYREPAEITVVEAAPAPALDRIHVPAAPVDIDTAQTAPQPESPSVAPLSRDDQDALDEVNLEQLERMRSIPGAAPLVDEIVEYLKQDEADTVSLDNIPADENGLAELDDEAIEHLIADPGLRAKWDKLMDLVAANSLQGQ
jgi:hypothetical protein